MTDMERSQILQMRSTGSGYKQIASALGLSLSTVKAFCRRAQAAALAPGEAECKMCGKKFIRKPPNEKQIFCSDKCRCAWWNRHKDQVKKKAFYQFTCKQCGAPFESYGAANRKFCSVQCYHDYQRKGG